MNWWIYKNKVKHWVFSGNRWVLMVNDSPIALFFTEEDAKLFAKTFILTIEEK